MLKSELLKKSPIRILEKSIHNGLGKGNLGVFTARKGVGKTASLVHIATDKLLRGQRVLHISFADDPNHIENWYNQVFQEVTKAFRLENAFDIYEQITRLRLIVHFKQKDIEFGKVQENFDQISKSVSFSPAALIVDGYSFDEATQDQLKLWKQFAESHQCEIWFSATLHRDNLQLDELGIPAPVNNFYDIFSVIIMLNPRHDHIDFKLLKAHDATDVEKLRLKLDPKTLLIANYRV